jgi:hypothetical protein
MTFTFTFTADSIIHCAVNCESLLPIASLILPPLSLPYSIPLSLPRIFSFLCIPPPPPHTHTHTFHLPIYTPQDALDAKESGGAGSYMDSFVRSMSLVLDEYVKPVIVIP